MREKPQRNRRRQDELPDFIEKKIKEAEEIRRRNPTAASLDQLSDMDREWLSSLVGTLDDGKCELPATLARRIMSVVAWFDGLHWGAD